MNSRWKHGLLALPGVGVSILPKLACPLCWPAYAGLLSSIGLTSSPWRGLCTNPHCFAQVAKRLGNARLN